MTVCVFVCECVHVYVNGCEYGSCVTSCLVFLHGLLFCKAQSSTSTCLSPPLSSAEYFAQSEHFLYIRWQLVDSRRICNRLVTVISTSV